MIVVGRGLVPRRDAPTAGDKPPPYRTGLTASDRRYQVHAIRLVILIGKKGAGTIR